MADVVARAPDHGVALRLVLPEHRPAVVVRVAVRRGAQEDEAVVVRDERHPRRDLPLVDARHPIHRGDELGGDAGLRGARRRRRRPSTPRSSRGRAGRPGAFRRPRGAGGLAGSGLRADDPESGRFRAGPGGRPLATERVLRVAQRVPPVVRGDDAGAAGRPRVDVPGPEGREDHGREALRRDVEADGGRRVVDPLAAERPDLGELRGQLGGHDRGLDDPEEGEAAVRVRQLEERRGGPDRVRALGGDVAQRLGEETGVEEEGARGPRPDGRCRETGRFGGRRHGPEGAGGGGRKREDEAEQGEETAHPPNLCRKGVSGKSGTREGARRKETPRPLPPRRTGAPYLTGYAGLAGNVNGFPAISSFRTSTAFSSWRSFPAEAEAGSFSRRRSGSAPWFSTSHFPSRP